LNGTIPALVSSKVGSPLGIKEELGIILCPFPLKKLKNDIRISSLIIITYDFRERLTSCQREKILHPARRVLLPRYRVICFSLTLHTPG
jgi:hypothetical protein